MVDLNFGEDDQELSSKLESIVLARVEEYTLSFFMTNLWIDSVGAMVIFAVFYFCCRPYRKDKERFI